MSSEIPSVLSIDIGSVAITIAQVGYDGKLLKHAYKFHHGKVLETLDGMENGFILSTVKAVVSPSVGNWFNKKVLHYDPQISIIASTKYFYPNAHSLLFVGAGRFQLIAFNEDGSYSHSVSNTSCAAGTGSFLDQQANRLNLQSIEDLVEIANANKDILPEIASRCAVFAKTDLVHAQQAGYSRGAICDSLCRGLAKNIADTLFTESVPSGQLVFAGGVALNSAVMRHLEHILDHPLEVNEFPHLLGAIGAGILFLEEKELKNEFSGLKSFKDLINTEVEEKEYFNAPLTMKLSKYPEFTSEETYDFVPSLVKHSREIQVEIYHDIRNESDLPVLMGIDIGSTSTKAVLMDEGNELFAGLYTYTNGDPLNATKALFEAIDSLGKDRNIEFSFEGVGTTGSGRKFIGELIGADLIIDEITAHAQAAYQMNPKTDTIIEIGGQDAKFTLMKEGRVTFAQMNSVCAAGTGSFIEEQAQKLGIKVSEISHLAEGASSPLASDRCTVFMERDINHYLNQGYKVKEILASTLHSVRENYLQKVANVASIGEQVCFQGATAKNKALVAAFEEKLGKEIFVSRYCHLTGALGTALMIQEEMRVESKFKGLDLYKHDIPVTTETCEYCNNRCRISLADVNGTKVAYGFLCGRDYDTEKFVDKNVSGFDLLKERKKILSIPGFVDKKRTITIGLPATLHLFDELSLWETFFNKLGIKTRTSRQYTSPLKEGKRLAGAEFCAPMHAMHGHVAWLADQTDYIFLPVYIEARDKQGSKEANYCYYTQFSPSVASLINDTIKEKCLVPYINWSKGEDHVVKILHSKLKEIIPGRIELREVRRAYVEAVKVQLDQKSKLKQLYITEKRDVDEVKVVLIGRPYLILSKSLNKGIPDIFAGMGIKTFYQDMIPYEQQDVLDIDYLLRAFPWHFATKTLEITRVIAKTKNVYPVFMTAFKCAPDSFVLDYFKKMLDEQGKPYLVLQLDEHDSNVGYETRIEAGIRAFRNHSKMQSEPDRILSPVLSRPETLLSKEKIVLFPNWDNIAGKFIVANLRRTGYDAKLLEHNELSMKKSMVHNSGQCLPINIVAQEYMDYITKYELNPANTILWMTEAQLTCNIRMYPQYIKTLLEKHGNGMEKASVYSGEISHLEISVNTTYYAYFAYMLGGLLRRLANKLRPYEVVKGDTDRALSFSTQVIEQAFLGNETLDNALSWSMKQFDEVKVTSVKKPLVAIFGDLFVRDNDLMNQQIIKTIEDAGGEVINTPYNDYTKITIENVIRRRIASGKNLEAIGFRTLLSGLKYIEKRYYKHFEKYLGNYSEIDARKLEKNLDKFNINLYHSGESYDNILKIFHILDKYPEVSLFVQTNPAFCCPSLITEAMKTKIYEATGVPIVTITYDGTSEQKNDVVIPYIHSMKNKYKVKSKEV